MTHREWQRSPQGVRMMSWLWVTRLRRRLVVEYQANPMQATLHKIRHIDLLMDSFNVA